MAEYLAPTISRPLAAGMVAEPVARDEQASSHGQRRKGAIIGGRYELVQPLGEGGMGSVWEAKHVQTRKRVALKFIKRTGESSPHSRRRMIREARAAAVIQHSNILVVHDILEVDGAPMLVMDLLEGESLGSYLARRNRLTLAETAQILLPVVSAISAAHAAGVVHRDLKPDNIFLVSLPDGGHGVKVLDFGLAKLTACEGDAATSGGLTRSGDIVGTPQYMAPEQAFGERDIDQRADIWAVGVILYECLTGNRPFAGDNLGQVLKRLVSGSFVPLKQDAPTVSVEVSELVGRMLSLDRAQRPNDLDELHQLLHRLGDGETLRLPAPSARPRSARVVRRIGWAMAAMISAVIGLQMIAKKAVQRGIEPPTIAAVERPRPVDAGLPEVGELATARVVPDLHASTAKSAARKKRRAHRLKGEDENQVPLFPE